MDTGAVRCASCGQAVQVEIPGLLDTSAAFGICQGCQDRDHPDSGGLMARLKVEPAGGLFPLGSIKTTLGAAQALADAGHQIHEFLDRHVRGDWSDPDPEAADAGDEDDDGGPAAENRAYLAKGCGLIQGVYHTRDGVAFWVLTDLFQDGRARTTILLPDES